MKARDIYRFINEQDDNTIQRIIDRLEFRGKDPTFAGYKGRSKNVTGGGGKT